MSNHIGGSYYHHGMMDFQRPFFQNLPLKNFLTLWNSQADPQITIHWIEEVDIAESIHKLLTSRNARGANRFP